jgi:hypothetical protein
VANLDKPILNFPRGCPDPGLRLVSLPAPLPDIGVDFDWQLRDFESFRNAMLEDLAARFPERRRWTSADLEVVLIEMLASVLDQLSDIADRVTTESYLETARQPESVYNWLSFIGMDLPQLTGMLKEDLLQHWRDYPHVMEQARRTGPASIHTQKRMVSLSDYAQHLEEHPLVERAYAGRHWGGAWPLVSVMISLWNNVKLDDSLIVAGDNKLPESLVKATNKFHQERGLRAPEWSERECIHDILRNYLIEYRSIGQEVYLEDIEPVGIDISLCLQVGQNYYQSEVRREALRVLGRGPGGFFEPGRLRVGEDLHMSDFYQRLMGLDGVDNVAVVVFKKIGSLYPNCADNGLILMKSKELAVCDNDSFQRERGVLKLNLQGGRRG